MKKWNRQQPVTREPGSSAFLEYLAGLERDVAAGGGGGGAAWGGITGTLSAQTDLQTALNGKANTSHTHSASDITSGTLAAARFDDTSHGSRSGGALHAAATTSVAGFMSAADKTKLDGLGNGGTATIGFGAAPGSSTASVTVTGQTGILTSSRIRAWVQGSTADYNEYEHSRVLPMVVTLGISDVVAGTGFTIQAATEHRLTGDVAVKWEWA